MAGQRILASTNGPATASMCQPSPETEYQKYFPGRHHRTMNTRGVKPSFVTSVNLKYLHAFDNIFDHDIFTLTEAS